jgi:hypothetical protein
VRFNEQGTAIDRSLICHSKGKQLRFGIEFSLVLINIPNVPFKVSCAGISTVHTLVEGAFSCDRIRGCQIDIRRLFQETDLQVEFLRHSLRRAVSIAWPYDVLNIQSFLFP